MACMAEWTSLSVKEGTRDRLNARKAEFNENQEGSVPDLSTDQFIEMLLDTLDAAEDGYYDEDVATDKIEQSLETIEERTGRIERTLEGLQR